MTNSGLPIILEAIFGKKELSSVSLGEVYELIQEFPSFNAGHLILAKKLKQEHDPAYDLESRKTALYFNNAYWLQAVLDACEEPAAHAARYPDNQETTDFVAKLVGDPEAVLLNEENLEKEQDPEAVTESSEFRSDAAEQPVETAPAVASFDDLMAKYKIDEESKAEEPVSPAVPEVRSAEAVPAETPLNDYGFFEEDDSDEEAFDNPSQKINTGSYPEVAPPVPEIPKEPAGEDPFRVQDDSGDYEAFDRPSDPDDTELTAEGVSAAPDAGSRLQDVSARLGEEQTIPAFDARHADSIVFTPYHVIDYFASQGIKLVLEDNPPDNLGKQLKSFTDWLRVMKRLPAEPGAGKTDERETDKIRHYAADSIEERDVLTESMAEVLVKQGMNENAISLYRKLSLIYPLKSAYFAARIEQIKASLQ